MLGESWDSFSKGFLYLWPRSYQGIDRENYANPDGSQNPQEGYPFLYINPTLWWDYYSNETTLQRDEYIGALTLTYDITTWLNITGRNDWLSTLPAESNSYFYPSISAIFIASEAFKFQDKIKWLNFTKLRGGWAHTATDTDPYWLDFNYSSGMFGGLRLLHSRAQFLR